MFESDDSEGPSFELKGFTAKPEGYWKLHKIDFFEPGKGNLDAVNTCSSASEIIARFIMSNFSSAYDCRLEHALEWRQETDILRSMAHTQVSCNMILAQASVTANPFVCSDEERGEAIPPLPDSQLHSSSAKCLLSRCLNALIRRQRAENLYLMPLLQLWLLLNQRSAEHPSQMSKLDHSKPSSDSSLASGNAGTGGSGESDTESGGPSHASLSPQRACAIQPCLPLGAMALKALLTSLTEEPHPLSVLHMGLRVIVLACNQQGVDNMVPFLLASDEFKAFLIRLLSSSPPDRTGESVENLHIALFSTKRPLPCLQATWSVQLPWISWKGCSSGCAFIVPMIPKCRSRLSSWRFWRN